MTDTSSSTAPVSAPGAPVDEKSELEEAEKKYWAIVTEKPWEFDSWTYLLQVVENADDIEKIRKAYDGFLAEYPLCYVYWNKYAQFEFKHGSPEKCIAVYRRGAEAVSASVDLWVFFCEHVAKNSTDVNAVRDLYEEAVGTVGIDWAAHKIWTSYLEFEKKTDLTRVAKIYQRILAFPIDKLDSFYEKFCAHATSRPIAELLKEGDDKILESLEDGVLDEEKRKLLLADRKALFATTQQQIALRKTFESEVSQRWYFHMKPLPEVQLKNWHDYLDFEEKQGDLDRTKKLYERCLVATANYSQFWLRYSRFLEDKKDIDGARNSLKRATTIFIKKRPKIHLAFALFEESQKSIASARAIYSNVVSFAPLHVETIVSFANFERRAGDVAAAKKIFADAVGKMVPSESLSQESIIFLVLKYAEMLEAAKSPPEEAREILTKACESFPSELTVWLAFLNFELDFYKRDGSDFSPAAAVAKKALEEDSKLKPEDRVVFWRRFLDVCRDVALDVKHLREAESSWAKEERKNAKPVETSSAPKRSSDMSIGQPNKVAKITSYPPRPQPSSGSYYRAAPPRRVPPPMPMRGQRPPMAYGAQAPYYPPRGGAPPAYPPAATGYPPAYSGTGYPPAGAQYGGQRPY